MLVKRTLKQKFYCIVQVFIGLLELEQPICQTGKAEMWGPSNSSSWPICQKDSTAYHILLLTAIDHNATSYSFIDCPVPRGKYAVFGPFWRCRGIYIKKNLAVTFLLLYDASVSHVHETPKNLSNESYDVSWHYGISRCIGCFVWRVWERRKIFLMGASANRSELIASNT